MCFVRRPVCAAIFPTIFPHFDRKVCRFVWHQKRKRKWIELISRQKNNIVYIFNQQTFDRHRFMRRHSTSVSNGDKQTVNPLNISIHISNWARALNTHDQRCDLGKNQNSVDSIPAQLTQSACVKCYPTDRHFVDHFPANDLEKASNDLDRMNWTIKDKINNFSTQADMS